MGYKLNDEGYELIKAFEGFRSKPYLCSAGIPTIGYGSTYYPDGKKVTLKDKEISEKEASELFKYIADKFAENVDKLITSKVNQNQFNSLVSFTYNLGTKNLSNSTLLKKVNLNPNDVLIKREFLKWINADGEPSRGLITRRTKEANLYLGK